MTIDFEGRKILVDEEVIYLTVIQNDILILLYKHKNNVVKYEEIIRKIYDLDTDDGLKTTIRKHISLLNKKIGKYITIKNVRNEGYIIEEEL